MERRKLSGDRLVIIGDIHGKWKSFMDKLKSSNYIDTDIILSGDVGFFSEKDYDNLMYKYGLLEYCWDNSNTVHFIRGNHDNPKMFEELDECIENNCIFETKLFGNVLVMGGSFSVDRYHRVLGGSYFDDELPVFEYGFRDKIDVFVTHYMPFNKIGGFPTYRFNPKFYEECKEMDQSMQNVKGYQDWDMITNILDINFSLLNHKLNPKFWVSGHYHKNIEYSGDNTNYKMLDINEHYEIII